MTFVRPARQFLAAYTMSAVKAGVNLRDVFVTLQAAMSLFVSERITIDIGKNTADQFLLEILPSVGQALAMSGRIQETALS